MDYYKNNFVFGEGVERKRAKTTHLTIISPLWDFEGGEGYGLGIMEAP